jgi:hypothetical protein
MSSTPSAIHGSAPTWPPSPTLRPGAPILALGVLGPAAVGAILALRVADPTPIIAAPAITLGAIAATTPALYIALAVSGEPRTVARAVVALAVALAAFGVALAGVVLPSAFLVASSLGTKPALLLTSAALAGAAFLALRRLGMELELRRTGARAVFWIWGAASLAIAGRLWLEQAVLQ